MQRHYYALAAIVAGAAMFACRPSIRSIAPANLVPIPADSVADWIRAYAPTSRMRYDLRWQFRDSRTAVTGRAAVRVAPPDSLRFDYRGPFGRSGAVVVVGDSGGWARPEGDLADLLQSAPLFWATLGMPVLPNSPGPMLGMSGPDRRAWRYAIGVDTFDFIDLRGTEHRLLGEMRRRGRIIGVSETRFDPDHGRASTARLDFPLAESRFTFSVEAVDTTETFAPDIWRRP